MHKDLAGNAYTSPSMSLKIDNEGSIGDDDAGGGGGTPSSEEDKELKIDVYLSDSTVFRGEIVYVQINVTDATYNLLYDALVKIECQGESIYAYLSESGIYICKIETFYFSPGLHEMKIIVKKDGYSSDEETYTINITDWILPRIFNSKTIEAYTSEYLLPIRGG